MKSKLESEGITTFLNLELRSSYTNTDEKCCDIHVIFSDDVSKEEIQNLLVKLSLNVGAAKKMAHGLKPQDLQSATVEFSHLHEILNDEALGLQGRFLLGFSLVDTAMLVQAVIFRLYMPSQISCYIQRIR